GVAGHIARVRHVAVGRVRCDVARDITLVVLKSRWRGADVRSGAVRALRPLCGEVEVATRRSAGTDYRVGDRRRRRGVRGLGWGGPPRTGSTRWSPWPGERRSRG